MGARRRPADLVRYYGGGRLVEASASPLNQEGARRADSVECAGDLSDRIQDEALGFASPAAFDSFRQPLLDFSFEPADGSFTEFDSLRKALFRLHPINH